MNNTIALKTASLVIITDVLVLLLVYFIPALSHLSPFPLYYLDPMRVLLFAAYLISRNNGNALILAATIPIFSSLVTGHPVFYKSLLISFELLINLGCFIWMVRQLKWHPGVIFFIAAVVSKICYYLFKYIFLETGLLTGSLKATDLDIQLYTVTGLSLLFAFFYKHKASTS
jgi:hypothetical protein